MGLELVQITGLWRGVDEHSHMEVRAENAAINLPLVKNKDTKEREGARETFGENRREVWLMNLMGRPCYMRKSKAHTEIYSFSGIITLCVCV